MMDTVLFLGFYWQYYWLKSKLYICFFESKKFLSCFLKETFCWCFFLINFIVGVPLEWKQAIVASNFSKVEAETLLNFLAVFEPEPLVPLTIDPVPIWFRSFRTKCTYFQYKFPMKLAMLKHLYQNHSLLSYFMLRKSFRF